MAQLSPDDAPLSRAQLARESGASETTLKNWHLDQTPPLEGTAGPSGRITHTWAQLRAFCAAHTDLPRAQRVLRENRPAAPPGAAPPPVPNDPATVRAVIADLRAAATSTLDAVTAAAAREEAVAAAHREQIDRLAATIRAYDDFVTHLAGPVAPYD